MIYVTGDTRGNFLPFRSERFAEQVEMTKDNKPFSTKARQIGSAQLSKYKAESK